MTPNQDRQVNNTRTGTEHAHLTGGLEPCETTTESFKTVNATQTNTPIPIPIIQEMGVHRVPKQWTVYISTIRMYALRKPDVDRLELKDLPTSDSWSV